MQLTCDFVVNLKNQKRFSLERLSLPYTFADVCTVRVKNNHCQRAKQLIVAFKIVKHTCLPRSRRISRRV